MALRRTGMKRTFNTIKRLKYRSGSVSVSLVLAWPFYIVISALVLEMILLCMNYVTVTNAVDRATSQAKQWVAHRDSLAGRGMTYQDQIHREVCKSLLPYVVTRDRDNEAEGIQSDIVRELKESRFNASMAVHYARRWSRISQSTKVTIEESPPQGAYQEITVHVLYESPFWIPLIGRLMGSNSETGAEYNVWPIRQSNRFKVLANQYKRKNIGIEYSPFMSHKAR
jgi:hypothetical protein